MLFKQIVAVPTTTALRVGYASEQDKPTLYHETQLDTLAPLRRLYLEMYGMQLLAIQVPDHDVSVRATCSHAAVSRTEGNCVYSFRVCADQSTIFEILNPAGFKSKGGTRHTYQWGFGAARNKNRPTNVVLMSS